MLRTARREMCRRLGPTPDSSSSLRSFITPSLFLDLSRFMDLVMSSSPSLSLTLTLTLSAGSGLVGGMFNGRYKDMGSRPRPPGPPGHFRGRKNPAFEVNETPGRERIRAA